MPPGRRTVNTDPLPGSLVTVTSPPIMRATMDTHRRTGRRRVSSRRTNMDKRMRVRWRQSWGDVFELLLKDRDLRLLLIIAVLGTLVGLAALFGVLYTLL